MRTADTPTRSLARALAAVLAALLPAGPAAAEKPRAKFLDVRVGLPPGAPTGDGLAPGPVVKFAAWAPLSLSLEIRDEIKEPAELIVEAPDGDEVGTTLAIPLPALAGARPGQVVTARDLAPMPYVRPAGGAADTVVRLRTVKGVELAEPFRLRNAFPAGARAYVVLSLGNKLPGFDLPRDNADPESPTAAPTGLRGGRIETAAIADVGDLPDKWFGYDAADLVVLATGTAGDDFLRRLFGERATAADRGKRAALLEWVRRGGRLVVSVGGNAGLLAQFPAFRELLPFALSSEQPSRAVPALAFPWESAGGAPQLATLAPRGGNLPFAQLAHRPDRPARVLLREAVKADGGSRAPVAVQSAYGLGRVSLLAFDVDRPPFTDYDQRPAFWDWVLRRCGSEQASTGGEGKAAAAGASAGPTEEEDELAAALRTHVDTFEGVPVISFGWVAVFIVLYILLIGPVEYYLLKRVFGRLELTWITFPVIVLTVSAAAYFAAHAVKGRDLRVNKVDLVEVDVAGGRAYGQTWFTVFSPRIDTYTATVAPAAGWTAETPEESARETLAGWVGSPRGGRASLVRRTYRYHVGEDGARYADALEDVPIQVWSTKSFTARWSARLNPSEPAVESRLVHPPGDETAVIGTVVNRMPFGEIRDAVAIYAGKAYPKALGPLSPGAVRQLVLPVDPKPADVWLGENAAPALSTGVGGQTQSIYPAGAFPLLGLMFHERGSGTERPKNASLRRLDQSWRLDEKQPLRDEVIVVGRVVAPPGPAEEALGGRYSPSQLWLKGLPGDGRVRPPIAGAARQETWVRLYLPVGQAGK